jgi:hypothetical protein
MLFYHALMIVGLIALPIVGLLIFGFIKLLLKVSRKRKIILLSAIALLAGLVTGWQSPIGGTLTGTWVLYQGFNANPRHIRPAPLAIRFFDDGTGTKTDYDGNETAFEWSFRISSFDTAETLVFSTRAGSYYVRLNGFGTRLMLEHTLRGDSTMGRVDTHRDFRAYFRRSD